MHEALASWAWPRVSAPVLSNTTVSTAASCSSAPLSLTMMPRSKSRRAATTCTIGTASPNAHGQVMISTAIAIVSAWWMSPLIAIQAAKLANADRCTTGE